MQATTNNVVPGVVVGTVVSSQPAGVDAQALHYSIHERTRNGRCEKITSTEAWQYMNTLSLEQKTADKYNGYKTCRPVGCCSCCKGVGIGGAYFMGCERGPFGCPCLAFPCCFLGVCLPIYSCVCCSCERKRISMRSRATR